jgi:hypothetical protein
VNSHIGRWRDEMANAKWTGDKLWFLLNESLSQLIQRYPQYSESTLKGKRAYWRRKIALGEVEMPEKPAEQQPTDGFGDILKLHNLSPELAREFTEQGFHVGYIRNKDGEIEYTIPLPHARRGKANLDEFTPAEPAKITPTKRKPVQRDHKILFVFSDAQIDYRRLPDGQLEPIHDERAMKVAALLCKDLQPDEIINLGDTVDLASLSRFQPDSDHFHRTLGPSFQRIHDFYAQLRADNPWSKITEVDSNHNTRLKSFVLKYAPSMYGLNRAGEDGEYPVLSYPFLANLGKLGVEWVSGYGAAEYVYGLEYDKPPIVFKHGQSVVSAGSTAAKESKENTEVNVVRGHTHRAETFYRTTRSGNYLASVVCGVLCRTTGEVPSYHSAVDDRGTPVKYQENWQQGVMVIHDYEGDYQFDHVPIRDGKAFYAGKEYQSD